MKDPIDVFMINFQSLTNLIYKVTKLQLKAILSTTFSADLCKWNFSCRSLLSDLA